MGMRRTMRVHSFPEFDDVVAYKWRILQYMLSRNDIWVARRDIQRHLNINKSTLSHTLKRMEADGWVVSDSNKRYKRYYRLGSRAMSFLRKYGDFIANNPYIRKTNTRY